MAAVGRGGRQGRRLHRTGGQGRRRGGDHGARFSRCAECSAGRRRRLRLRPARHPGDRLLQHPARRHGGVGPGRLSQRGLRILDAPVSGGEPGAKTPRCRSWSAAPRTTSPRPSRFSTSVGKTIVHVGPSGSGQTVKAANQLIVAGNIELLAEAITFLKAYGVDIDAAVKVLGGGLAGSAVLDQKAAEDAAAQLRPRLPHRPAPQGHGHRHRRRPRGRCRDPARRSGRAADGLCDSQWRRWT